MQINFRHRWLLVLLLLLSTCLLVTYAGRRGGGSRGSSSRGRGSSSRSRPTYRPAPASRPSPRPAYRPSPKPAPKPTPRPSAPEEPVVAKQPASNPNFKETSPVQGSADKQPAYNPNYKPDAGGAPAGPPPPYSPVGQPAPGAPAGPPPPYGAPGHRPPYPQQPGGQPPPYPAQPPPYSGGPPGRPPAYPGQSAPYPVQPGGQPYPQQPGANRPYPVQPGYPGGYPQQPGINRPYPVQPGVYPGGSRPYPQQPLGGNVWQPKSGMPAPAYMNYGGIPTGTNMYTKPHKQKGFMGSLMSVGSKKNKPVKENKYGSYPSPYGVGAMGGGFPGKHGKSAAMYSIMPYAAYKAAPKFKPKLGGLGLGLGVGALGLGMFMMMPLLMQHRHYGYDMYPRYAHYYDIYSEDYVGKCFKPIKKEHTDIRCKSTFNDIKCDAKCQDGFEFPENITLISNRCWHATGIWRPKKNFPDCTPICEDECMNEGECIRPGVCKCPVEFRGDRCQFHFLDCDIRKLTHGQTEIGWVCAHSKNETVCKIRCKEPAEFESPPAEAYKCSPEGVWTPDSIPKCLVKDKKDSNSAAAK